MMGVLPPCSTVGWVESSRPTGAPRWVSRPTLHRRQGPPHPEGHGPIMKLTSHPAVASSLRPAGPAAAPAAFDFFPQTRVVFGPGSLARLGELTRELGGHRILVVTDAGLKAAGHPARALDALRGAGLEAFLFDGVEENPTTRQVHAGLAFARQHRVDFLVAVGGGSSMDCAKGINFL